MSALSINVVRSQFAEVDEEQMQQILDLVEWHERSDGHSCVHRHGVIRDLEKSDYPAVSYTLTYYYGSLPSKGAWWQKQEDDTWVVEFVEMTKVAPPPQKPWEWCGEAMYFTEWQQRFTAQASKLRDAKSRFRDGDWVTFVHNGQTHTGLIANKGPKRATVMVGHSKWHVPYALLTAK